MTRTVAEALIENGLPVRFGSERDAIDDVNSEVPAGVFEVGDGALRYVHELRVDAVLVGEAGVMETLHAGVSVMHHYAPGLLD